MLSVSTLISRRLLLLVALVVIGGCASLAKSFNVYGQLVLDMEALVGGDWVMHLIVSTTLGFFASWATPKHYFQTARIPVSPWVGLLLIAVTVDEFSQLYFPSRQFSFVDLGINLSGVLLGSFCYFFYLRARYPAISR